MPFDSLQPHNDLSLFPLAAELETKAVLKSAIVASRVRANLFGQALKNMELAQVDDINVVDLIDAKVP